MELTNLRANQIHIVGFSMGAHVAGYIGKRIPNVYRITGITFNVQFNLRLKYTNVEDAL